MNGKKLSLILLAVALLMALGPAGATATPEVSHPPQPPEPGCGPRAAFLSAWMGVECAELVALHEAGIGFGVMMKAYFLSQTFTGLDWRDLVDQHITGEGLGWGQVMKAHYLAELLGADAEELLAERAAGKGWGEILREHEIAPGKPPWAGQGKPPWAGGPGKPSPGGSLDQGE